MTPSYARKSTCFLLPVLSLTLLTACTTLVPASSSPPSPHPTLAIRVSDDSGPTAPTSLPPTPTSTNGWLSSLTSARQLPSGEYVIASRPGPFSESLGQEGRNLDIFDLTGTQTGTFGALPLDDWAISPNSEWLAYVQPGEPGSALDNLQIAITKIRDGSSVIVPGWHSGIGSITADGRSLLIDQDSDISLLDTQAGTTTDLSLCPRFHVEVDALCTMPALSPSGEWVAFFASFAKSGPPDPRTGTYFMSSRCLAEPESCATQPFDGPYAIGPGYAWSPTGTSIAFPASSFSPGKGVSLFDMSQRAVVREVTDAAASSQDPRARVAWSPSGRYLATSWGTILDLETGAIIANFNAAHDGGRLQWIAIPGE